MNKKGFGINAFKTWGEKAAITIFSNCLIETYDQQKYKHNNLGFFSFVYLAWCRGHVYILILFFYLKFSTNVLSKNLEEKNDKCEICS